jgi:hypothetical protein
VAAAALILVVASVGIYATHALNFGGTAHTQTRPHSFDRRRLEDLNDPRVASFDALGEQKMGATGVYSKIARQLLRRAAREDPCANAQIVGSVANGGLPHCEWCAQEGRDIEVVRDIASAAACCEACAAIKHVCKSSVWVEAEHSCYFKNTALTARDLVGAGAEARGIAGEGTYWIAPARTHGSESTGAVVPARFEQWCAILISGERRRLMYRDANLAAYAKLPCELERTDIYIVLQVLDDAAAARDNSPHRSGVRPYDASRESVVAFFESKGFGGVHYEIAPHVDYSTTPGGSADPGGRPHFVTPGRWSANVNMLRSRFAVVERATQAPLVAGRTYSFFLMMRDDNTFWEETRFEASDALVFDCGNDFEGLDDKIVFGSAAEFTAFWGLGFDAAMELFREWRYATTEQLYVLMLAKAAAVSASKVDRFAMCRSDEGYVNDDRGALRARHYDKKVECAWETGVCGGKCPEALAGLRSKLRVLREGWASGTPRSDIAHQYSAFVI